MDLYPISNLFWSKIEPERLFLFDFKFTVILCVNNSLFAIFYNINIITVVNSYVDVRVVYEYQVTSLFEIGN